MPERSSDSISGEIILFPGCDPTGRLSRALTETAAMPAPEAVIVDWLVSIPAGMDPALAAEAVLNQLDNADLAAVSQQGIITLLQEVALHPREKLSVSRSARRRQRRKWLSQTGFAC